MRPLVAAWLAEHGLSPALAPGYGTMVGVATLLAAAIVLAATRRDGADVRVTATALLFAYAGALLGGYVYEWIRVTPAALASLSVDPYLHVGRAAYGGLIFASLGAAWPLRRHREPIVPFFDRAALAVGVVFLLVRTGCLLEGCDFGVPTDAALAVRYPAGALAAVDHVVRGWVPPGTPSLPVHPTQLYEGAVALAGSGVALALRRPIARGALPPGSAFAAWLVVYAIGRAAIETLRADADRGLYLGASTAQWTSLVVVVVAILYVALRRQRAIVAAPLGGAHEA